MHSLGVEHAVLTLLASPTEQRPLTNQSNQPTRVYSHPQFRRQQEPKADPALQQSALSTGLHNASHSTVQARQDSAIDQHRFEASNDAQLSKPNVSYSHQSPKDSQRQPSPRLNSYQPAPAYAPVPAPHQGESHPSQTGAHFPARQHSKSVSSGAPSAASPRSHEHGAERTVPIDITRSGPDTRPNNTGPSSLPDHFYGQSNNNGTRQQRYNVRFAANYTSENMPPSQKPRNDPPTPTTAPAAVAEPEPEQSRSSPVPVTSTEETPAPVANGNTHHTEPLARATTRDSRDRDREPSVERCPGCNEAWRRPIPDMDSDHVPPAENNAEYMRLASNMIERLRNERKKADAAYDEWRWRHSHCYRPTSPHSTGSIEDVYRRADGIVQVERPPNGNASSKRKSEIPHEPRSASKQQRVSSNSPAPPVRQPDP